MTLEVWCTFARRGFMLEVDIAVRDGEMVAVSGPNGSGKSTLLHLVGGLLAAEEGSITHGGRLLDGDFWGRTVFMQPERRHVGLLPQGGALFPHMSVLDNVAFGVRARGADRGAADESARTMLEQFGIDDFAGRMPHELSGGQRQRVALARTLMVAPKVLLLDEPMNALDVEGRADVVEMLAAVKAEFDGPMILVSHDRSEVETLADRAITAHLTTGPSGRHSRIS